MYKECKTEQSIARQRELAFGLLSLMQEVPYPQITISNYCAHMGIPRKTFYRYFPSKDDALELLVDLSLLDIGAYPMPVEVHTLQPFQEEMIRFFHYWSDHRHILQTLLDNSHMEIFYSRAIFLSLTEMAIFRHLLGHLAPAAQESIVAYYIGGIFSMLMFWLKNGFQETPEEMAARLLRLVGDPTLSIQG